MSCRCPPLRPLGMPVNDARDRAARDAEAYCDLPIREAAPVERDHPRYVRCLPLTGKVRRSGLGRCGQSFTLRSRSTSRHTAAADRLALAVVAAVKDPAARMGSTVQGV